MTKTSTEQITLIANKISKKFSINKIFLFGSYAYGNPISGSDIDLCLVAKLEGKRKIDLLHEVRKEIRGTICNPLNLFVYEEKEFNERASLNSTLEHKILTDGIQLYG